MEKGKGTVKRVFTAIGNVIIWLFVIFAAVITVFTFAAQSSEDGIPAIGSTAILTVSTDSMKPVFEKGDIIIGRKLAPEEQSSLKVGDVITFDAGDLDGDNIRDFNTHRIVEVVKDDSGVSYITKGDNKLALTDKKPVPSKNVICRYTGK
ncbi:MAG: signal peptidase I, partial [Clostridia bacterium]|nr:signal peptidase I [Clostridia bacterium]